MPLSSGNDQLEELPLTEIFKKYNGKWVALIVTQRDRNLQPLAGKIVSAENDRYRLRQKIAKYNDICITFAGEPKYPLFL